MVRNIAEKIFYREYYSIAISEKVFRKRIFFETTFVIFMFHTNCHLKQIIFLLSVGKKAKSCNRIKMNFAQDSDIAKTSFFPGTQKCQIFCQNYS
jgi:hypothetical protein